MLQSTCDLTTALVGGYVGEIQITPKRSVDVVHFAITGKHIPSWKVFYYETGQQPKE